MGPLSGPLWIPAQCVRPAKDVMASSPEPNTGNEEGDSSDSTTSLSLSPSQLINDLGQCDILTSKAQEVLQQQGKEPIPENLCAAIFVVLTANSLVILCLSFLLNCCVGAQALPPHPLESQMYF